MGERAAEPEGEYVEIRGGEEGEGDETEAEEKGGWEDGEEKGND